MVFYGGPKSLPPPQLELKNTPHDIGLNRNGQGVSYDEIQGIDTTWAAQQINQNNIVLPSNMVLYTFTQAAADNWNRATDSVTGNHLDIVNLVMFQSYQKNMELGSFINSTNTSRAPRPKERK